MLCTVSAVPLVERAPPGLGCLPNEDGGINNKGTQMCTQFPALSSPGGTGPKETPAGLGHSRTWMFLFAQISFNCRGQTLTVTSPRWAVRRRYMKVRAWPMPPPMESGIWSFRMAWW